MYWTLKNTVCSAIRPVLPPSCFIFEHLLCVNAMSGDSGGLSPKSFSDNRILDYMSIVMLLSALKLFQRPVCMHEHCSVHAHNNRTYILCYQWLWHRELMLQINRRSHCLVTTLTYLLVRVLIEPVLIYLFCSWVFSLFFFFQTCEPREKVRHIAGGGETGRGRRGWLLSSGEGDLHQSSSAGANAPTAAPGEKVNIRN